MLLTTANNNLFDTFFNDPWFMDPWSAPDARRGDKKRYNSKNLMLTDITESDQGYELEMELPGFDKSEIQATLEKGYLTITAEKKTEQTKEKDAYIRKERFSGTCQRTFFVGEELEQEDIKASFKDGILKLAIPKKEAKPQVEERKCITIQG
ncbi:Hsp20/alpha crystallin family protein [Eubacterium oxidoreducens]|uniref:Molecular chaperone IbpA, HSP20 family n=1 Tax=Eubacterium oxidoreducens TaxID=1732 RepID=A0A1G6AXV3_EUBOX|nr:Hsp20/alpha crystallin family protein [Eubacterium oxidoreducens]SDB13073.1 Molecular chaperone IbpA, HSP20 family [Eubacterium oxidoreducens]